jgi:hypothetical protein
VSRYHLDLSQYDLEWLQHRLEAEEIVPKRRILQERIAERFAGLPDAGVKTVSGLVTGPKTRAKIDEFAETSRVSTEYLVWLGREARSYLPNPFALEDIPGVDGGTIGRLEVAGIKSTKPMFDQAALRADRLKLSRETGVPDG